MQAVISFSLVLLASLLFACNSPELGDAVVYCYSETGCADPWSRGADEAEQISIVTTYLEEEGIDVKSVSIVPAPEDISFCLACQCTTGRTYEVEVAQASAADLLALEGFWYDEPWVLCEED